MYALENGIGKNVVGGQGNKLDLAGNWWKIVEINRSWWLQIRMSVIDGSEVLKIMLFLLQEKTILSDFYFTSLWTVPVSLCFMSKDIKWKVYVYYESSLWSFKKWPTIFIAFFFYNLNSVTSHFPESRYCGGKNISPHFRVTCTQNRNY